MVSADVRTETVGIERNAIAYFLDRIQRDPDLRWFMLHTEAFRRLCRAEAAHTGETPECVGDRRSVNLVPKHRRRPARLPLALKHLEALAMAATKVLARFGPVDLSSPGDGLKDLRDAVDALEQEGELLR